MANFRIRDGSWIKVVAEVKPIGPGKTLVPGAELQVLSIGTNFSPFLTFVGVHGVYNLKDLSGKVEPLKLK